MNKKFVELLNRKKAGTSTQFIFIILAVMAIFILMMQSTYLTTNESRFQNVNQIGREYLLQMESAGCLSSIDQASLLSDLNALGYLSNITITAPISEVGYGNSIALTIDYDITVKTISFTDLFHSSNGESVLHKTFSKKTTSKH